MVIELLNFYLPVDLVLWTVLDGDWEVTSIVEESELRHWDVSPVDSAGNWLLWHWLQLWSIQAGALSSKTITLLQDGGSRGCDGNLLFVDGLNGGNASGFFLNVFFWEVTEGGVLGPW